MFIIVSVRFANECKPYVVNCDIISHATIDDNGDTKIYFIHGAYLRVAEDYDHFVERLNKNVEVIALKGKLK